MSNTNQIQESLDQSYDVARVEPKVSYVLDEWEFVINSQTYVVRFTKAPYFGPKTANVDFGVRVGQKVKRKFKGIPNLKMYLATVYKILSMAHADPTDKLSTKNDGFIILLPDDVYQKNGDRFVKLIRILGRKAFKISSEISYPPEGEQEGMRTIFVWRKERDFKQVYSKIADSVNSIDAEPKNAEPEVREKKYYMDEKETTSVFSKAKGQNVLLMRIVALKDFGDVKKGSKGGFIESEDNLSQYDNSWVYGTSRVFGPAVVKDNASVSRGIVSGNSVISGNAVIRGNSTVKDSNVSDNALVNASTLENSFVSGSTTVSGSLLQNSIVSGSAEVLNSYFTVTSSIETSFISGYSEITNSRFDTPQSFHDQEIYNNVNPEDKKKKVKAAKPTPQSTTSVPLTAKDILPSVINTGVIEKKPKVTTPQPNSSIPLSTDVAPRIATDPLETIPGGMEIYNAREIPTLKKLIDDFATPEKLVAVENYVKKNYAIGKYEYNGKYETYLRGIQGKIGELVASTRYPDGTHNKEKRKKIREFIQSIPSVLRPPLYSDDLDVVAVGYLDSWVSSTTGDGKVTTLELCRDFGKNKDSGINFYGKEVFRNPMMYYGVKTSGLLMEEPFSGKFIEALKILKEKSQKYFADRGITTVKLYRGVRDLSASTASANGFTYSPAPLESWTTNRGIAKGFGDTIMSGDFPVESILWSVNSIGSLYPNQHGYIKEEEYVIEAWVLKTIDLSVGASTGGTKVVIEQSENKMKVKIVSADENPNAVGYDPEAEEAAKGMVYNKKYTANEVMKVNQPGTYIFDKKMGSKAIEEIRKALKGKGFKVYDINHVSVTVGK